jgi:ribosomal protein S18 acetylase RimI-like enzyme
VVTGDILIRSAVEADAPRLAAFAERTFRETFTVGNRAEDMDAYCRTAFDVDGQRLTLVDPAIETLIVENAQQEWVAYAQLRVATHAEVHGPSPIELWRFYVDRAHHGRGIANHLMAAVIDRAAAGGARTLWLGVWERNHRALAFYRKCGFADVGSHRFVLGTDVQTDRIMARSVGVVGLNGVR